MIAMQPTAFDLGRRATAEFLPPVVKPKPRRTPRHQPRISDAEFHRRREIARQAIQAHATAVEAGKRLGIDASALRKMAKGQRPVPAKHLPALESVANGRVAA